MEKASEVYVVLSDFGWSDLGTWKSLYDISPKDENGNVLDGNTMTYETKDCIIKTPKDRLVVTYGLEGFIVAEYDNVLLICKKDEEQRCARLRGRRQEPGRRVRVGVFSANKVTHCLPRLYHWY
jgi:mannose-1-phosphate guanylyltransferase